MFSERPPDAAGRVRSRARAEDRLVVGEHEVASGTRSAGCSAPRALVCRLVFSAQ